MTPSEKKELKRYLTVNLPLGLLCLVLIFLGSVLMSPGSRTLDGVIQPDSATSAELATHDAKLVVAAADVAGINGAAMRGTDNGALAAVATEARLAQLDAANMPAELTAVKEHFHSYEHWFGPHDTPVGETTIAVSMGVTNGTFQIDGGNDIYGAWVQILGSSDTPHVAGKATFQIHGILISAVQRSTSAHVIQIGFGDSGAAALAADDVLEVPYKPSAASLRSAPIVVQTEEAAVGTKVWARVRSIGQVSGTLDFYFGLHEGSI